MCSQKLRIWQPNEAIVDVACEKLCSDKVCGTIERLLKRLYAPSVKDRRPGSFS
ncbi:MAG: hypothetical protein ACLU4N_13320 [Butyricimonas faecihominis]